MIAAVSMYSLVFTLGVVVFSLYTDRALLGLVLGIYCALLACTVACFLYCAGVDVSSAGRTPRVPCLKRTQDTTRYCRTCGKTVPGLDHHCSWLNTCVGTRTYPVFYALATVGTLLWTWHAVAGVLTCTVWRREELESTTGPIVFTAVVSLLGSSGIFAFGSLWLFHTYLLLWVRLGTYDWLLARIAAQDEREQQAMQDKQQTGVQMAALPPAVTGIPGPQGTLAGGTPAGQWSGEHVGPSTQGLPPVGTRGFIPVPAVPAPSLSSFNGSHVGDAPLGSVPPWQTDMQSPPLLSTTHSTPAHPLTAHHMTGAPQVASPASMGAGLGIDLQAVVCAEPSRGYEDVDSSIPPSMSAGAALASSHTGVRSTRVAGLLQAADPSDSVALSDSGAEPVGDRDMSSFVLSPQSADSLPVSGPLQLATAQGKARPEVGLDATDEALQGESWAKLNAEGSVSVTSVRHRRLFSPPSSSHQDMATGQESKEIDASSSQDEAEAASARLSNSVHESKTSGADHVGEEGKGVE